MNATILALSLLGHSPMQTVYLQRTYLPGVKDTYEVSVAIDNNPAIRGKLVALNSTTTPSQRELMFYDERSLRSKVGLRDPMIALFNRNGLLASGDFETPKPVYAAFALSSFVPIGAVALDGSAGTNYSNDRLNFVAMTHVENTSNARSYANLETIVTIEPKGGNSISATINSTVDVPSGRMTKAHLELRRSRDSRLVADFQLVDSKGG